MPANFGQVAGDGYNTVPGQSYIVTPSATFDGNNGIASFAAVGDLNTFGSPVTVNGGSFDNNADFGFGDFANSSVVNIYGGSFSNNLHAISVQSGYTLTTLNIYGGSFTNNAGYGVTAEELAAVNIYGGTFAGNGEVDFEAYQGATITLYGSFSQYGRLSSPGFGSFSGTLADGGGLQTFTDDQSSGQIILAPASAAAPEVPEASTLSLLGSSLGGMTLCARRRRAA